jgi:hypothetical protein
MNDSPELFVRLIGVQKLFEKHPLLEKKMSLLQKLHPQHVLETQDALLQLQQVLVSESHVWHSLAFHSSQLHANPTAISFDTDLASVRLDASAYNFDTLKSALVNKSTYSGMEYDYGMLLVLQKAQKQKNELQDHLARQNTLVHRALADMSLGVVVSDALDDIHLSVQDQQVLLARLPPFYVKR